MQNITRRLSTVILLIFVIGVAAEVQSADTLYVFTGAAGFDQLGGSVASAGDVNNDGYADLIVGATLNDVGGLNTGRAYVFSGLNGDTLHQFGGEIFAEGFGVSVASAGDVNNDGYDDVIVGASGFTTSNFPGRAIVFSGLNGDTLHIFTVGAIGDSFGGSVASAGDVNNDGIPDLIVGAILNDAGGVDAGRAYVYSGLNGNLLYTFTGEAAGDEFGVSVASAGDVNNDGFADLIVGSRKNAAAGIFAGRAYVFSGQNGDTLYVFTGAAPAANLGRSVASAGDVNNDGFADLIVGADNISGGLAYVISGQNGDTLHIFTGEAAGDAFGISVASAGDVNNDGFADLIVGAMQNDAAGLNAGRAYVFSGQNGDTLGVFTGEGQFSLFGISVASAGDVNNDGFADLIVGAAGNTAGGGTNTGRAYVYSGAPAGGSCCVGVTGNIDCDPGSVVDIADLTVLIDHLFISLTPLCCREQGNVDGDIGAVVDIADLTFLIDHLFITLVPTSACQ